jgi:rubrerythrin
MINRKILSVEKTIEFFEESFELISKRTAESKTFENSDGIYKTILYVNPMHYQDPSGNWFDMDELAPKSGSRSQNFDTIQPGPNSGKDTFISNSFGYNTNEELNWGADPDVFLTHDVTTSSGFYPFRWLIKFNIESLDIPLNTEVINANLNFTYYRSENTNFNEDGISDQMIITTYPLTRDWVEGTGLWESGSLDGVSWNDYDGTNGWTKAGGDYSLSVYGRGKTPQHYGWTTVDVKDIVQGWINNSMSNHGFILMGDAGHKYFKQFRSSDFSIGSERPKLEIEYKYNNPPIIKNSIDKYELEEDESAAYLNLDFKDNPNGIFADFDIQDSLNFYVWDNKKWSGYNSQFGYESETLTANIENDGRLRLLPKQDKHGSETLMLKAKDLEGEFVLHNITIEIKPVNDPPLLNRANKWENSSINPDKDLTMIYKDGTTIVCLQDSNVDLFVTASDIESDTLFFKIEDYIPTDTNLPENIFISEFKFDRFTGNLNFTPDNNWIGTFQLNISVNDGKLKDWKLFTFKILNINDNPHLLRVNGIEILNHKSIISLTNGAIQDKNFNLSVVAYDPDIEIGLEETLWFVGISDHVLIFNEGSNSVSECNFSFTPDAFVANIGYVIINVSIWDSDGSGLDDWALINISVLNVNDPPEIKKLNNQSLTKDLIEMGTITVGEKSNVSIEANDIDGELLICVVNGSTHVQSIGENRWNITFIPESKDIGIVWINVSVTDTSTNRLEDSIALKWRVTKIKTPNKAPNVELTTFNLKGKPGEIVEIEGNWFDDGKSLNGQIFVFIRITRKGMVLLTESKAKIENETFRYDYKIPNKNIAKLSDSPWMIEVWATDGDLNSTSKITLLIIEDVKNDKENLMSIGLFDYDIVIILILIIIALIISFSFTYRNRSIKRKFKSKMQTMSKTPKFIEPVHKISDKIKCISCGTFMFKNSITCPNCKTPNESHNSFQQQPLQTSQFQTTQSISKSNTMNQNIPIVSSSAESYSPSSYDPNTKYSESPAIITPYEKTNVTKPIINLKSPVSLPTTFEYPVLPPKQSKKETPTLATPSTKSADTDPIEASEPTKSVNSLKTSPSKKLKCPNCGITFHKIPKACPNCKTVLFY